MNTEFLEIKSMNIIQIDSISKQDFDDLQIKLIELSNDPIIHILTETNFKWMNPNNRKASS